MTIPEKVTNGLKVLLILILLLSIGLLAIIQFKSDAIVEKAIGVIQHKMQDTLVYEDVSLEWFRYFPSAALEMKSLRIGEENMPLIEGNVDVVLRLWPLLKEQIVINRLRIYDSRLHITKQKGRWSYEIFKKEAAINDPEKANVQKDTSSSKWNALIKQIEFENTTIHYNDREGTRFILDIGSGNIEGDITGDMLDAELNIDGTIDSLYTENFKQSSPFPFTLDGLYKHDLNKGRQSMHDWHITSGDLTIELNGGILKKDDGRHIDLNGSWTDADPGELKKLLPLKIISNWDRFTIDGNSSGEIQIKGLSSAKSSPHIKVSSELKHGTIKFPDGGGQLKNILLHAAYDSGDPKSKSPSSIRCNLRHSTFEGKDLKADIRVSNLDNPVMSMEMKGMLPASFLNLFMDPKAWDFKDGAFDIDHYTIEGLHVNTMSTKNFIDKSEGKLTAEGVSLTYNSDNIKISDARIDLDASGKMNVKAKAFTWNLAKAEDISGVLAFSGDVVRFDLEGQHSQGLVKSKGMVRDLGDKPVLEADWTVTGIEMQDLLTSFENFDQSFITSENLSGKADLWTHSIIPYDAKGNVIPDHVNVRSAIEIKDGKLKNLKTLEDFSQYVHLEDLREIHFNEFRNYMRIENGKVYLPVMFIQSSAINMSINGVHSFNQDILYNIKINAGQTVSNKLKKKDPLKRFKQAKKSGWINLYYVLSGNVNNVQYEQDQKQVVSSFEQSRAEKEKLRKYLVDRFGHDVYWIEPNEWEDIPEYK